jgi:hypothetical protein
MRLALTRGDLACNPNGAPYVARALINNSSSTFNIDVGYRLAIDKEQLGTVRRRLKDGEKRSDLCPGVVGLSDADWHTLDAIEYIPTESIGGKD